MSEREGPRGTSRRGIRSLRWALALVNGCCAAVTLGVGSLVLLEVRDPGTISRPTSGRALRSFQLPSAKGIGEQPLEVDLRAADLAPPPLRPTPAEDAVVLADARTDFARQWRVVFAGLEGEPAARTCIIAPRGGGEQMTLNPGDRVGAWLLVRIDPQPGAPRSVLLAFRELRRQEDVLVLLSADP